MAGIPAVQPARDHVRGAVDGSVTLVEYGDFECPYCGDAYPVVRALLRTSLWPRFVFRHMPLSDLHRAAGRRRGRRGGWGGGRFWDMPIASSRTSTNMSDEQLHEHAAALGLDVERFDRELREGVHTERVAGGPPQRRRERHPEHAPVLRQRRDPSRLGQRGGAEAGDRGGVRLRAPWTVEEHDACALYAWVAKDARPEHDPIPAALAALQHMLHRAGGIDGQGTAAACRSTSRASSGRRRCAPAVTRPTWCSMPASPSPTS